MDVCLSVRLKFVSSVPSLQGSKKQETGACFPAGPARCDFMQPILSSLRFVPQRPTEGCCGIRWNRQKPTTPADFGWLKDFPHKKSPLFSERAALQLS